MPRLAGFARVQLSAGERRTIELDLEPRVLARWDEHTNAFRIAGGEYIVRVGAHALDVDDSTVAVHLPADALR